MIFKCLVICYMSSFLDAGLKPVVGVNVKICNNKYIVIFITRHYDWYTGSKIFGAKGENWSVMFISQNSIALKKIFRTLVRFYNNSFHEVITKKVPFQHTFVNLWFLLEIMGFLYLCTFYEGTVSSRYFFCWFFFFLQYLQSFGCTLNR